MGTCCLDAREAYGRKTDISREEKFHVGKGMPVHFVGHNQILAGLGWKIFRFMQTAHQPLTF